MSSGILCHLRNLRLLERTRTEHTNKEYLMFDWKFNVQFCVCLFVHGKRPAVESVDCRHTHTQVRRLHVHTLTFDSDNSDSNYKLFIQFKCHNELTQAQESDEWRVWRKSYQICRLPIANIRHQMIVIVGSPTPVKLVIIHECHNWPIIWICGYETAKLRYGRKSLSL